MSVMEQQATVTIDKLLVATDFSGVSDKAVAYAMGMALRCGASVDVTHVFDPSVVNTYAEALLGLPLTEREKAFGERLREVGRTFTQQGITAHTHLPISHDPARSLLEAAGQFHAELIVTGTQSKRGIERFLLGSTAEKLIRGALCPVLTVGPYARWPIRGPILFRNIVFATDLSDQSAKALPYALSFAQDSGAHLHLCMVTQDDSIPSEQKEQLAEAFRLRMKSMIPEQALDWCTPVCVVEHGDAAASILRVAQRVDADLIVLGARKSSFWLSFIEHGLTPDVLSGSVCPVMTVC